MRCAVPRTASCAPAPAPHHPTAPPLCLPLLRTGAWAWRLACWWSLLQAPRRPTAGMEVVVLLLWLRTRMRGAGGAQAGAGGHALPRSPPAAMHVPGAMRRCWPSHHAVAWRMAMLACANARAHNRTHARTHTRVHARARTSIQTFAPLKMNISLPLAGSTSAVLCVRTGYGLPAVGRGCAAAVCTQPCSCTWWWWCEWARPVKPEQTLWAAASWCGAETLS